MLKWKGLLSYIDEGMRRRLMSMLLLVCISMIVTQLSYIVVGDAHFIFVLAPVVAASLLFGTLAGTVIGGITGLMVMIHARMVPYDVYERYFQSPITSVLLFSLIGFFMGFIRNRAVTMILLALGFFLILGLIFMQAHILVGDLAAKPIRETCQVLGEIAEGSSASRVNVRGTSDFIELSDSINKAMDSVRPQA